jgi:hypothetical protein
MVIFSLGFKTDFNVFLSVSSQCAISSHLVYVLKNLLKKSSFNLGRYNSLDCFMAAKIILSNLSLLITFRSDDRI